VIVYNMLDVSCITIAAFASLSLRWNLIVKWKHTS